MKKLLTIIIFVLLAGLLLAQEDPIEEHGTDQERVSDVMNDLPEGVTSEISQSIQRGLAFLARQHRDEGFFEAGPNPGAGYLNYRVAMCSLAGMAFVCQGNNLTSGEYSPNIQRITYYLLRCSEANDRGYIISQNTGEDVRGLYSHGFATMFLASVSGTADDRILENRITRALEKAIDVIERSQSDAGGWYYRPDMNNDEGSVTVTQIQALRACRNAGLAVSRRTIEGAIGYLEGSLCEDGGIAYSITGGTSKIALTAAAIAVFYNAGTYDSHVVEQCLRFCRRRIGTSVSFADSWYFHYLHYYLAQVYWQVGGENWSEYYNNLSLFLLEDQNDIGSWSSNYGDIFGTAISVTILSLPYELAPLYMR